MVVENRTVDSVQNTCQYTVDSFLQSGGKYTADFAKINRTKIFKKHESARAETSYKYVARQKSCNAI